MVRGKRPRATRPPTLMGPVYVFQMPRVLLGSSSSLAVASVSSTFSFVSVAAQLCPYAARAPKAEATMGRRDVKIYAYGKTARQYFSARDYWSLKRWMPDKIDTSDRYFLLGFAITKICRHGDSGKWWEEVVVDEGGMMTVETFLSFTNVQLLEATAREVCQLVESQSLGGAAKKHRFRFRRGLTNLKCLIGSDQGHSATIARQLNRDVQLDSSWPS